jgi:sec-independent protein translocase protein TatA
MTPIATSLASLFLAGLPGGYEWLIVLVIVLLLFGRRLPGVARSLGQGISSFKKGLNEPVVEDAKKDDEKAAEAASAPAAEKTSSDA